MAIVTGGHYRFATSQHLLFNFLDSVEDRKGVRWRRSSSVEVAVDWYVVGSSRETTPKIHGVTNVKTQTCKSANVSVQHHLLVFALVEDREGREDIRERWDLLARRGRMVALVNKGQLEPLEQLEHQDLMASAGS
jgi:hypothetical protein